jgi:gamma-glutamyltranspeptidase/glutathione hydrolase
MDVQQAHDAPRLRHWRSRSVSFESAMPESTLEELASRGHLTHDPLVEVGSILMLGKNQGLIFGGGQSVMKVDSGYVAGSGFEA